MALTFRPSDPKIEHLHALEPAIYIGVEALTQLSLNQEKSLLETQKSLEVLVEIIMAKTLVPPTL